MHVVVVVVVAAAAAAEMRSLQNYTLWRAILSLSIFSTFEDMRQLLSRGPPTEQREDERGILLCDLDDC